MNYEEDPTVKQLNFCTVNARSLVPKAASFVDMFRELGTDVCMVTETWLRLGSGEERLEEEMRMRHGIGSIVKSRESRRGGGVALFFDTEKLPMERVELPALASYEAVGGVSKTKYGGRKLIAIAAYAPPSLKACDKLSFVTNIAEEITRLKVKHTSPYVILGGDFNNIDISPLLSSIPEMKTIMTGPTRGNNVLDLLITNFDERIQDKHVVPIPLETEEGGASDHRPVAAVARLPHVTPPQNSTHTYMVIDEKGVEKFKGLLLNQDWRFLECLDIHEAAEEFNLTLQSHLQNSFQLKTITRRKKDRPWISQGMLRKIRKKKKIYRAEGRSERWKDMQKETDRILTERKEQYYARFSDKLKKGGRNYHNAVKSLRSVEAPTSWNISELFPQMSEESVAEKAAEYFNSISDEFEGIGTREAPTPASVKATADLWFNQDF